MGGTTSLSPCGLWIDQAKNEDVIPDLIEFAQRMTSPLTVRDIVEFLLGAFPNEPPRWPPDMFAVVATILERTGAYTCAVDQWPPGVRTPGVNKHAIAQEWTSKMEHIGGCWALVACTADPLPDEILERWRTVFTLGTREVGSLCASAKLCGDDSKVTDEAKSARAGVDALLELCAMADEACVGIGIPDEDVSGTFWLQATGLVTTTGTLCRQIHQSRVRVLPKLHTPQTGMTMRSLTHHLALSPTSDVTPSWWCVTTNPLMAQLNLLILPWPRVVAPKQFQPITGPIENIAPGFGFFTYDPASEQSVDDVANLPRILQHAKQIVGHVDGVVFPELALGKSQYDEVRKYVGDATFVVAGIAEVGRGPRPDQLGEFGRNYYQMHLPDAYKQAPIRQAKHHRWKLDRPQVLQYGLGGSLRPDHAWWEYCSLEERRLAFVALTPWLTLCVLICEDLARQDPVAELVRAVGPNLVIALLMDGPQLKSRWAARYATVLADDPGSSVLTLTSVGMAELSRSGGHRNSSRTVALWHDARLNGPREIELDKDAEGIVLSLAVEQAVEWTADGRSDRGQSGFPILAGVHQIRATGRSVHNAS